MICTG